MPQNMSGYPNMGPGSYGMGPGSQGMGPGSQGMGPSSQGMGPGSMVAGAGYGGYPGTSGPSGMGMFPTSGVGGLGREQSYIENILRLNRGKEATVYMTFENNAQWGEKIFKGIIEEAGKDHIVVADPQNGKWYLLLMIYLDYVSFDEEIEYEYPFNG
ncbi:spore coat protein GerQ [Halalkalibacillus sediminis]|uniref:Spore coat protein GerQ n=2 Tax=Halalkalibacillus sediminis TaxID=2018042 RepID=A0A2I0QTA7_9BACI|nr:spore coat protein GerQ [Halalkalibacillus sediminis]